MNTTTRLLLLSVLFVNHLACSGGADAGDPAAADPIEEARRRHHDGGAGRPDLATAADLSMGACPAPQPPAASCDQRHAGVTGIQLLVRIDEYQGLIHGRNGDHEIAYGTVSCTPWVFDGKVVDTGNVQLAMNVASAKDSQGLPREIRLSVGQLVEVAGEYIPAATASAHDGKGPAAVVHYTHSPCGYVQIDGTTYR